MNEVLIESLDHQGRGIARINNKVIFIENALPGEIVDINITKEKKRYSEGSVIRHIKNSKKRIDPICPYYNICGGCNLMHLSYEEQLKFKENKINDIIKKYLSDNIKVNEIIVSDNNLYYRNKVTFKTNEKIGFYKKESNNIVCIDNCFISNNLINSVINNLNQLDLDNINEITCRANNEELMVVLNVKNNINEEKVIGTLKDKCSSIIVNDNNNFKCIYKDNYIINKIGNLKYYVTNNGFFQINDDVTYKLYSKIKEYCELKGNELILDLYCGSGTIGLFLSDKCKKVIGVEINKSSIECANMNKKLNKINNCEFICDSTDNININIKPDIIIVDPPRSGLSKKTIQEIINYQSPKIIYVSCDPMTLVRDLKLLSKYYNIQELTPFDMFPNTHHVESVVLLNIK